jgi:hypothetical protein
MTNSIKTILATTRGPRRASHALPSCDAARWQLAAVVTS